MWSPAPPVIPEDDWIDEGGPGEGEDHPGGWGGDEEWKHGGSIGRVLRRQAGGMVTHEGLQGFGMESPRPFGIAPFSGGLR